MTETPFVPTPAKSLRVVIDGLVQWMVQGAPLDPGDRLEPKTDLKAAAIGAAVLLREYFGLDRKRVKAAR